MSRLRLRSFFSWLVTLTTLSGLTALVTAGAGGADRVTVPNEGDESFVLLDSPGCGVGGDPTVLPEIIEVSIEGFVEKVTPGTVGEVGSAQLTPAASLSSSKETWRHSA